jgi:hypothetical protein
MSGVLKGHSVAEFFDFDIFNDFFDFSSNWELWRMKESCFKEPLEPRLVLTALTFSNSK